MRSAFLPEDFVKPDRASVQAIWPIIGRERVGNAVKDEPPVRDSIAVTADQSTEIGAILEISGQSAIAKNDIIKMAATVRREDGGDDPAVRCDLYLHTALITQRIELHRRALGTVPEALMG